jgi:hypothetical protein
MGVLSGPPESRSKVSRLREGPTEIPLAEAQARAVASLIQATVLKIAISIPRLPARTLPARWPPETPQFIAERCAFPGVSLWLVMSRREFVIKPIED